MKYLYPFECEKHNLSTIEELNSAIDGNRRDSRNIQSPPGSPPSALNPNFALPFASAFPRNSCFDAVSHKYGVFGFPGMMNPVGVANPSGLLQPAVNKHLLPASDDRNKPNFGMKSTTPTDIFSQSALAAFRTKFLSTLSAAQHFSSANGVPTGPVGNPVPSSANQSASALFGPQNPPSSAALATDMLAQRVALAHNQQLAVMQVCIAVPLNL